MSTTHTPGALKLFNVYADPEIRTPDGEFIANLGSSDRARSDTRRLVACWNACVGVDTTWLERCAPAHGKMDAVFSLDHWLHANEKLRTDAVELQRELDSNAQKALEIAQENDRLKAMINTPELDVFLRAVHLEALHQVERWGTASDRAKRPADWFWLVGYLAGKALHAALGMDQAKALHHCISTAAALYNWHCAIKGTDVRMCPGSSDVARIVDSAFPGEVQS